jgi:hypothetical protein
MPGIMNVDVGIRTSTASSQGVVARPRDSGARCGTGFCCRPGW